MRLSFLLGFITSADYTIISNATRNLKNNAASKPANRPKSTLINHNDRQQNHFRFCVLDFMVDFVGYFGRFDLDYSLVAHQICGLKS